VNWFLKLTPSIIIFTIIGFSAQTNSTKMLPNDCDNNDNNGDSLLLFPVLVITISCSQTVFYTR